MNEWLCEPLALGRRPALRPRQGADRRGARGRTRVRPLSRRRRRRHPLPHLSRHAPDQGRLLHPRHLARTATPATPRKAPTTSTTCSGCCASSRRRSRLVPAPVRDDTPDEPTRIGVIYYGSTDAGDARGAGGARRAGPSISTRCASAPSPSATSVADFIAEHDQVFVVEQNRDAQLRTLLVNECGIDPARLVPGPALRRHADHRALHRRRHRPTTSRALKVVAAPEGTRHDLHRQAEAPPPEPADERARLHPPRLRGRRSRRSAPAAATIRSPPRSSRPASSSTCRRTASPSCRASAARRRRRPISSARATASTACTAACRRCRPAPTSPTAT